MPNRNYNWRKIEQLYVESDLSLAALGRARRIPLNTLKKQSVKRSWSAKRKAYRAGKSNRPLHVEELPGDLRAMVEIIAQEGAQHLLSAIRACDYIVTPSGLKRLVEIRSILREHREFPPAPGEDAEATEDSGKILQLLAEGA